MFTESHSHGEVLPPIGGAVSVPEYAPAEQPQQQQSRAERGGFNPASSPATYTLVAVNCAVFLWMVFHGVSLTNPAPQQLVHYGAMSLHHVLAGQWYRLLTATFLHIGIIHIGTNMWCLWNLGMLGEPLLGAYGLAAVYMLTGVAGNLLGLAWNTAVRVHLGVNPMAGLDTVGAGASGAVFGIAGILIVLLSNQRLPIDGGELKRLRRSVIQFAVLNLIIGGASNFTGLISIDNSAHVGGFLSGLALGVPLMSEMTSGRVRYLSRQKATFLGAGFFLALFGYWISRLR